MSIVVFEEFWDVEYTFTRGASGTPIRANGDIGTPDDPHELDISSIRLEGSPVELIDYLSEDFKEELATCILEAELEGGSEEDLSWDR